MRYRHILFCAAAGCAVFASFSAPPAPAAAAAAAGYRIIARYQIGGNDTGYDYLRVDAAMRRLYVAHATRVEVLNVDTGELIGQITGMRGVHGIELVPELGKGYTSDGVDRAITVFDRSTLQVRKRIRYTGEKPDAIAYDPDTRRLFVVNGGGTGDVTVIDPTSDSIVDLVELGGGKLEQIRFDGRGRAFVNDEQRNLIHVFDTRTLKPLAAWPVSPCEEPTGMAVDQVHHRVFSACGNNKLAVLDSDDGRVVAMAPIGSDPDGAWFDPATQRIFTSNKEGTLSVLHEATPERYETVQTLSTGSGARTITADEKTGHLFLPTVRTGPAKAGGAPPLLPETFAVLVVGPADGR
ncbi:MAG TPA: YncE family protein [Steroidobacteraceae bacterium]|nr:YncE family protein [Steroidobacteraceae bacterium]